MEIRMIYSIKYLVIRNFKGDSKIYVVEADYNVYVGEWEKLN